MNHPGVYTANAASMWSSLDQPIAAPAGVLGVAARGGSRYLIQRPPTLQAVAALLDAIPPAGRVVVENPYGLPQVSIPAVMTARRMPVMNRPADPATPVTRAGVTVLQVTDAHTLADAERVIIDGFPLPHLQPWVPGQALPPLVLKLPGWRIWLAHRHGRPAAAGYTYDDGAAVGVYWLATLPEHRSAGVGKALMTAMLAAHPGRTATLVATAAGVPLYAGLAFSVVSTATWYTRAA